MSSLHSFVFFYNQIKIDLKLDSSITLLEAFSKIQEPFQLAPEPNDFIFFTTDQSDINDQALSSLIKSSNPTVIHVISKDHFDTISNFLKTQYPSFRVEVSRLEIIHVIFFQRINRLHNLSKITDFHQSLSLSLIPNQIVEMSQGRDQISSLLEWFHSSFRLITEVKCHVCNQQTKYFGNQMPLHEELVSGAFQAERYLCQSCNAITRYLRYNSIDFIIRSMSGKADEAAVCLVSQLLSLGYIARFVCNFGTNHVWVEVFLENRFIHLDVLEGVFDQPRVYQDVYHHDVRKCLAISEYEIVDVTQRYHDLRPEEMDDDWPLCLPFLRDFIDLKNKMWSSQLDDESLNSLKKRHQVDSVSFEMTNPINKPKVFLFRSGYQ